VSWKGEVPWAGNQHVRFKSAFRALSIRAWYAFPCATLSYSLPPSLHHACKTEQQHNLSLPTRVDCRRAPTRRSADGGCGLQRGPAAVETSTLRRAAVRMTAAAVIFEGSIDLWRLRRCISIVTKFKKHTRLGTKVGRPNGPRTLSVSSTGPCHKERPGE
jgi:hypothetical protein